MPKFDEFCEPHWEEETWSDGHYYGEIVCDHCERDMTIIVNDFGYDEYYCDRCYEKYIGNDSFEGI